MSDQKPKPRPLKIGDVIGKGNEVNTAFGCVNNTIRLRSGIYLDLADPQLDQITLDDIAGGLSKLCRFGGQIETFYSVAEHCVHCAEQAELDGLPIETQIACLMHDAAEAFIGDMVKPLKIMMPEYKAVEENVESVIRIKFGIDGFANSDHVRKIDHEMLIAERCALFTADKVEWAGESQVRKIDRKLHCLPPSLAESWFMRRAKLLGVVPVA